MPEISTAAAASGSLILRRRELRRTASAAAISMMPTALAGEVLPTSPWIAALMAPLSRSVPVSSQLTQTQAAMAEARPHNTERMRRWSFSAGKAATATRAQAIAVTGAMAANWVCIA